MIFPDTSVWISAFRSKGSVVAQQMGGLLEEDRAALAAPVRAELLSGVSSHQLPVMKRVLTALPTYYPSKDTWDLLDRWIERAVKAGERFGIGDLLVGAIAAERGGHVWSLDGDFQRLAKLGLLKLHKT